MDNALPLRPATTEEIAESISFALRYDGRKRVSHADEMMARITADRLVRHLRGAGFIVMRQPTAPGPNNTVAPTPVRPSTAADQDADTEDQGAPEGNL
jgi:hypothetical protein